MADEDSEIGDDRVSEVVVNFGTLRPIEYRPTHDLGALIGQTVEAIGYLAMPGQYGDEPATRLFFADGSYATFLHPREDQ